ncbi:hypothetical protein LAZ67_2006616, partial [Cordylochernes scorpioides]
MVDVNATKCKLEYANNDLMKMSDIFLQKLEDEDLNDEVENCIDKCIRLKCELDLRHNGQETSEKKVNLHVKMPKLELPTFDGRLESWLSFKDLFYSAIGSNSQIPEIEKLQYLKGQLRGEALRLVNAFPITADNYVEVWQTLLTRYDNPKDLIFTQIDNALRLPKLADDNHKSMFKLLDSCNEIVRTVKVLGYQIDSLSDVFFVEIIQDKLDKTTRKKWELQNNPRVVPSIKDLMEFLEIHAKSLQNLPNKDANVEKHSIRRESHKEMEESSIKRETAPRMEVQQKQWGHPGRSPMDYSSKRRPCRICLNRGHAGRFQPENRMVETRSGKMQDPAQERIQAEESAKPQPGATIGRDASSDPVVLNPNIDIPKYDGTEDPRPWIESLEEIGFLYHWADYIISRYAAMNMTGSAKTWLNLHKASFTSWENIKIRLIQDFSLDANKEELRMKLNRMQHWNEPAIRFAEDILVLCNKVDPAMVEETKIEHVIGGLKKEYSFALYLNPPKTTDDLLVVCKKMDYFEKKYRERVEKSRNLYDGPRYSRPQQQSRYVPPTAARNYQTTSRPQAPVSNNYKNDSPPTPRQYRNNFLQPSTPRRPYNPNFVPKPNLQRNTYNKSQEVSKNRTEDGRPICFKCNKPGHVARYCRVKFIRILEEDPADTQEKVEEKCQMNEISEKSGPRLYADIGTFEALVDTGADLSVVDLRTALDTGHGISKLAKICAGPDGKKLDMVGSIFLNIKIDDETLSHNFVVLKTHLRTLILGRDFLKKMNAKIDCKQETIKYDLTNNHDEINFEMLKIKSAKDSIVPECSMKLINALVETEDGEYIIEESSKMFQTNGLRLARSLINVINRETYIWITNPYPRPLKIMKNQTLAFGSSPAKINVSREREVEKNEEPRFQINENLSPKEQKELKQVLERYGDLFSSRLGRTNLAKHRIDTEDAKPIKHKPYRVSAKERDIIKEQIDEMLTEGIIRPSSSPWSFPVILVKKRDGKYRFCVDYRKLNNVTVKDVYPIPRIDEVMDTLQGSTHFSAIDLRSGYWQVEVEERDKEKTAFTTAHGLYEFNVMPFGLCNAPATFERNMENMLGNLRWQICLCYLDDVIIYSPDFPTHLKRLEAVFRCFRESNLRLNDKKCRFAFEELEILGYITSKHGIKPAEHNIKAVRNFPRPKKVKEVQSFLEMCSYYRKFIKDFSKIADPLTNLIKKSVSFTWTERQEEAFQTLKTALLSPPILGHFNPNAPTYVHTDASNIGIGATLVQDIGGEEKVISYLSRTLSKAEQNYSNTEKECLAVVWSMSKLRPYLYGRHFKIVTDHHALCWLKNLKDPTGRLARWALKIQEYDFDIIHKSGKKHLDADGFSRGPLPETDWDEDFERLFLNQITDEEDKFIESVKKNLNGSRRSIAQNFKEEDGCLFKKNPNPEGRAWLLVVPENKKREIMKEYHNHMSNGHLGVARTMYRIKSKYFWPSMLKDVSEFVKTCHLCQSRKGSNQLPSGLLQPIPPANFPFERIGIDFVGPLPSTKNRKKWIIVLTDYYTRYAETRAVSEATVKEVSKFLVEDIFLRHGAPQYLISDRGSQFTSNLMKEVMKTCKIKHCFTTSYHPQTNGLTERLNRTLINMLSMYVNTDQKNWDEILPFITHAYNTTIQETTGYSPFFLMFGRELTSLLDDRNISVDIDKDDYDEYIKHHLDKINRTRKLVINNTIKTQERMKKNYDKKHMERSYEPGELVAVWTPIRKIGKCREHDNMAQPTGSSLRSGAKIALKEELGIVDGGKSDSKDQTETDSSKENLLMDEKPDIAPGSSQLEPNVAALVTVLNNQQQLLNKLVEMHLATGQERMAKMEVERFNGRNVDPLIWIQNYEIICQNNNWKSSQTKFPVNVNGVKLNAFLDPGSSIDLIRKNTLEKYGWKSYPAKTKLTTINHNSIFASECIDLELEADNRRIEVTAVILEEMPFEILLGKPTMKNFKIQWDFHSDNIKCLALNANEYAFTINDVQENFPSLCEFSRIRVPKFEVDFLLKPDCNVIRSKPYSTSEYKRKWISNKIKEMLDRGIIVPSTSEFASPCVLVPKKDSSFRLCQDYRRLNRETHLDPFPFPSIDRIIDRFGGCHYFTKIDLRDGFWQIGLTKESRKISAFVTQEVLYEFTRLPFGWKNSPPKFQRIMTEILGDLLDQRVVVYINDICCGAPTKEECAALSYKILTRLAKFDMTINLEKFHTDHRALTQLLSCGNLRDRLARRQLFLSSFEMNINHRSGKELQDADALSRLAIDSPTDPNESILWTNHRSIDLKLGDNNKYLVPPEDRDSILHLYHDDPPSGGHSGFLRTYHKLRQRFYWYKMKNDIRGYRASCPVCQQVKFKYKYRPNHMSLPPQSQEPFHTVHLDYAEAPTKGDARSTFLIVIDEATRLAQAKAIKQDGRSLINYFEQHIENLKKVRNIITDQGKSFVHGKFPEWAKSKNIRLITTTPYHPAGGSNSGREPILQPLPQRIEMEDDHRPTVSGSYLPCQRQRDPSTFSGDGNINPGQWLKEYERVSKYNRWDETMKLANVVFYLNGTAGRWFDNNEESLNSWRSFEDAFRGVFGLQEDSARRAEEVLKSRAQKAEESSESYIQEILSLCHQVNPRMEEGEIVAHIIKGISEDTYQVLVAKDIQTVDEILKFCRHLTTVKQRRIGRTKFARLSNVMPISCVDDSDDLAGLIRRIVREEIQKVFSAPEVINPLREVNALEQTVREEVSRALQPTRPQVNVVQQQPRTPYYNIDRPTQPRKTEHWRTYDDKPICFHCGRPGHVVRYCRERRQPRKVASPKTIPVASPSFQPFSHASECEKLSGAASNGGEVAIEENPPGYIAAKLKENFVMVEINGRKIKALVDSGADFSVISDKFRRELKTPLFKEPGPILKAANKNLIETLGKCVLNIEVNGLNISFEFVVMVECSHDIIFGWDFFKATEAVIDCDRNELHLGETSVLESREEENQRLFASDDFVIPPKSIKKISVINEEICGVRDVLVSTSKDLLLRKEVLIPNSLVTFRHGRGSIWVANGASWPQLIPSGMNMCTMESYDNGNICSLIESSDKLQETQLKSREWSQKINLTLDPGLSEIQRLQLVSCLDEFIGIFDFGSTPIKPTSTVKHKINTGDQSPIKQRPYRVAPSERRLIQDEVNKMIENHIVKPSESPWSSPVILVRKKDGTWRFCVDYRRLNKTTKKDVYPLPRIDDALDSLAGSSYFSTMDLRSGYWQIEVDEKDREKTAFITPDGLYEFQVMPFGLCNAPATFERMIDSVLGSLKWNMCLCYLDDIVVYAPTFEEHLRRLQLVLSCIQKAGLHW